MFGSATMMNLRRLLAWRTRRQLEQMRADWDERASLNARHFVATSKAEWDETEFSRSGEATVASYVLTDMDNICQGKRPKEMRVLEIGCGAGRVTRALAGIFGEVYAVDISGVMIVEARKTLASVKNALVFQNNGADLSVIPDLPFDFAFSTIVFQHVPSREVIYGYVREVHRLLRPGRLFKFQVLGGAQLSPQYVRIWKEWFSIRHDSWVGVFFDESQARRMASSCGFELRHLHGADEQDFWLWFFKQ